MWAHIADGALRMRAYFISKQTAKNGSIKLINEWSASNPACNWIMAAFLKKRQTHF